MVLNQGEKKTVGGEQTEESLPQSKALGGSAPLPRRSIAPDH